MKLFLKISISLILAVLLLACLGAGLFWNNWNKNAPAKAIAIDMPTSDLTLGEATPLTIKIKTPWYRYLDGNLVLNNDTEASLTESATIQHTANLSGNIWILKTAVIPFKEGKIKDLTVTVSLSPDREKKQRELSVDLPLLNVKSPAVDETAELALKKKMSANDLLTFEKPSEPESQAWVWPALAAAILLIAAFIFMLSSKKPPRRLSPWEIARNSLAELKKELTLNDEAFFVKLSDILRQYIERRFALPATEKTSEEFIQQLRSDSILSEKQRIALERFLGTADLVKFAKMNADDKQKNECLSMADNFVNETIPQVSEGQK